MNNKRFSIILTLVVLVVFIATISTCCKKSEPPVIEQTIAEDTIVYTPEQAAHEMLQIQESMIYNNMVDSTFRRMPEDIIIRIVLNNPLWTIEDIVWEYINNKDKYDKDRDDFEKIKQFQNPDTIPIKAKPDVSTERCEEIIHTVPLNYVLHR